MSLNRFKILQYLKLSLIVGILVLLGASVLHYQPAGEQSVFIVTALIAVAPVVIFELWNEMKRPHVVVSGVNVVDFPHIVYDIGEEQGQTFNNGICVRVYVKNIGFETAKDCACELSEENIDEKFPARWSIGGINPISADLSPNEEQFVDTLWYMYNGEELSVPTNIKQENLDFGGQYRKSSPANLNELEEARFSLLIRASNMEQRSDAISIRGRRNISLPKDIKEAKEFNLYTRYLIEKGSAAFAYAVSPNDWVLYIPEGLDLHKLANMPFLNEILFSEGELVPEAKRPVQVRHIED